MSKFELLSIKATIYAVRTTIKCQSCAFIVVIMINQEPGLKDRVPLNRRYQKKFNHMNLIFWPRGPGLSKYLNLSWSEVWRYHLIIIHKDCRIKTTIYVVITTIERQPFAFLVAIMINLESGSGGWVSLKGRCQTKFNQVNLVPGPRGQVPLICPILSLLSMITFTL